MWRTSIGNRVLEGLERSFYLELMKFSIDELTQFNEIDRLDLAPITGDRIFDSATFGQRIILLHDVLCALLDPSVAIPKHNNVIEAAAYFPFAVLRDRLELEIESELFDDPNDSDYYWREFIWLMFEKYSRADWEEDKDEDNPKLLIDGYRSNNLELFRSIIEDLEERIFWDMDWQDSYHSPQILDGVEPAVEEVMRYGDYFTTHLPKTTKLEVDAAVKYIKNLH
jgi:hypothetical protein